MTRFHTKPTIKAETVAEHSYLVAWLATLFYNYKPSAALLLGCLAHDVPEYELGDIPSPAKRKMNMKEAFREQEAALFKAVGMPDFESALTEAESEVLHFCDQMAGYLKCVYELAMGNTHLRRTSERYAIYMLDTVHLSQHMNRDRALAMLEMVKQYQLPGDQTL